MQYSVEEVGGLVCERRLRGAHRRALLGVRQERHDPRPAEGLLAGRDPARAVRRGGAQFQEQHREGAAGGGAGGADRRGLAERGRDAARCARPSRSTESELFVPGAVRLVRRHRHGHSGGRGAAQALDSAKFTGCASTMPKSACRTRTPLSMENVVQLRDRVGVVRAAAGRRADSGVPGPRYRLGLHQRGGDRRVRHRDPRRLPAHRGPADRSRAAGAGRSGAACGAAAWRSAAWAPPAPGAS